MRAVIQRVTSASVHIGGQLHASIGQGMLILLGISQEDDASDIQWLVRKTAGLRIFDDEAGVMNRSVVEIRGEALVVSQFTLLASTKKGNRPSGVRWGPANSARTCRSPWSTTARSPSASIPATKNNRQAIARRSTR